MLSLPEHSSDNFVRNSVESGSHSLTHTEVEKIYLISTTVANVSSKMNLDISETF
jgi:hypothetical protein